jgi:hypothetical protein
MINHIRNLFRGIKNLISWFKVIYNDRDWDNAYMEIMLYKKLCGIHRALMQDEYVTTSRKKSIQALSICIAILERRLNEWYMEVYDLSPSTDGDGTLVSYIDSDGTLLNYRSNLLEVMSIEKRDQQVLWKLIQKYSEYWWT